MSVAFICRLVLWKIGISREFKGGELLCVPERFFPNVKIKIFQQQTLLMRGFLPCLTEGCPDIISVRFLWPWAKFEWK